MKPLENNPFYKPSREEQNFAKSEIKAFIEHECEYAELPKFEKVTTTTSMERYKKACRQLRTVGIEIRQTKGRIIACKNYLFYEQYKDEKLQ